MDKQAIVADMLELLQGTLDSHMLEEGGEAVRATPELTLIGETAAVSSMADAVGSWLVNQGPWRPSRLRMARSPSSMSSIIDATGGPASGWGPSGTPAGASPGGAASVTP